jgi:hypothetical protein
MGKHPLNVAPGRVAVFSLGAAGCATIVNGTTQPVAITSTPSGPRVSVDGADQVYTTPANIELSRGKDHLLSFSLAGYHPETFTVIHSMSGVVAGYILAGGLIGWGVDAAIGAQDKLTPETVQITLNPLRQDEQAATTAANCGLGARLTKLDQMYSQKLITAEYEAERKRLIDEEVGVPETQPQKPVGSTSL